MVTIRVLVLVLVLVLVVVAATAAAVIGVSNNYCTSIVLVNMFVDCK